jgi:hypothetical protein
VSRYFYVLHKKHSESPEGTTERKLAVVLAWGAGVYSIVFVWIALHVAVSSYHVGTLLALVTYSVVAVWLLVTRHTTGERWRRDASTLLVVLVVARLLLVDVWNSGMDALVQVLVFIGVGVLLIAGAWVERSVLRRLGAHTAISEHSQE